MGSIYLQEALMRDLHAIDISSCTCMRVSHSEGIWFGRYEGAVSSAVDQVAFSQPYQLSLVVSGNAEFVADPVEILDIAPVPGDQLAFLFSSEAGQWYSLEWINPVTASNWAPVHVVNAQNTVTAIAIPRPSTNRFYRVLKAQ